MKTTATFILLLCLTSSAFGFARINPVVMKGIMNGALGEAAGHMKYAIMAMYPQLMQSQPIRQYLLSRVLNEQNFMQFLMMEYPAEMSHPMAMYLVKQVLQHHMVQYIAPIAANFRQFITVVQNEPWLPLMITKNPLMTMKLLVFKMAHASASPPAGGAANPGGVPSPGGSPGGHACSVVMSRVRAGGCWGNTFFGWAFVRPAFFSLKNYYCSLKFME